MKRFFEKLNFKFLFLIVLALINALTINFLKVEALEVYPVFTIKYPTDKLAKVNIKWKYSFVKSGLKLEYYKIVNGKDLKIGYVVTPTGKTTLDLDVKLNAAIPPLRVILTEIGKEKVPPFPDVYNTETLSYIEHLKDMGVVSGRPDGNFGPDATVTRAEFIVMLLKSKEIKIDKPNVKLKYSDIEGHWSKEAMLTAINKGILKGYDDKTLKPDSNISLAEVSTVIAKSYKFKTVKNGVYSKLKTSQWYSSFVKKMFDVGVLKVTDTLYSNINELDNLKRDYCAMMLSRAIATY